MSYICKCGNTMEQVDDESLECPECGRVVVIEDYDPDLWDDDDCGEDIPEVCEECGGPYPECVRGCNYWED